MTTEEPNVTTNHNIIAWTYDADYHCSACTLAAHGEDGVVPEGAEDSEGNEVRPVFTWNEWAETEELGAQTLNCSDCGAELDSVEAVQPSET